MRSTQLAGPSWIAATAVAAMLGFTSPVGATAPASSARFSTFESGHVRPMALSPDGQLLFAVNTPDSRLEVFRVRNDGLEHRLSIPVGLEPVAVASRNQTEVWVVNHLSDSVSVVELSGNGAAGSVVQTLLVGDEPRDIVFAGPGRRRAFITTAHRGQNTGFDAQTLTPGVGRADVWVFDANALGTSLPGTPLTILNLFTDVPRALAVSADGRKVYAAGFHTGNQTTVIGEAYVPDGFGPGGALPPSTNFEGLPAPEIGLIAKWNGEHWLDLAGRSWDDLVRFSLPDSDVHVIDAMATPPVQLSGSAGAFSSVGTILYNMAVNPQNGNVYVSNTEANNLQRFEGPGVFAGDALHGRLHFNRISVLSPGGGVAPRHLNKHVDYSTCCAPLPNPESETSLALPMEMAISNDGATLYVAALGSDKIGVFATAALESDTFVPNAADHIEVPGGGPSGLLLDDRRDRLYVFRRFDNSVSVIDTATRSEVDREALYNPEPPQVSNGRRFLYDARSSSSHGDQACASCHVFGDLDGLGWDLSNPDDPVLNNPGPFIGPLGEDGNPINVITGEPFDPDFHPIKGVMMTQSLRGMANHGPMHWRGDRTGGNDAPSAQPDSGSFDERAAFQKFQVGFVNLLRRHAPIPQADMDAFTDFMLEVMYPPNPLRGLDNSETPEQLAGRDFFTNSSPSDHIGACIDCHTIEPGANPTASLPGFFGTSGNSAFVFQAQAFKFPHLRNLYQKVGMFGVAELPDMFPQDHEHQGDQIRGFGFTHEGSFDTTFRFHSLLGFSNVIFPGGFDFSPAGNVQRAQVDAFLMVFPTNVAPIVGQQVTLRAGAGTDVSARIALLESRAALAECDLVAKAFVAGAAVSALYLGGGQYQLASATLPPVNGAVLQAFASSGAPVTYTCAPPGSGVRLGLDRDQDGVLDADE
jgi:DNA-binding beta-propeller fold protein YncE